MKRSGVEERQRPWSLAVGNGGRVRALAWSEEGSEQRRGRASEGDGELGRPLLEGAEAQQGGRRMRQRCSAMVGAWSAHGGCVDITPNSWRALEYALWIPFFSTFKAYSVLGTIMEVVDLIPLSHFY